LRRLNAGGYARLNRRLIGQLQGREVKTSGGSFMVAFKCVGAALDNARAVPGNTGHLHPCLRAPD
jgi:hypothetical protein